jgi:hypothetical protein
MTASPTTATVVPARRACRRRVIIVRFLFLQVGPTVRPPAPDETTVDPADRGRRGST